MIALRPFSRKVGRSNINVIEGRPVPKIVLDSYTSEELKELKEKKIIGDSAKPEINKKQYSKQENK